MGGKKAGPVLYDPVPVSVDSPVQSSKWLYCSGNETSLAAYLLFHHAKWVRRLLISWPILIMFDLYSIWSKGLTKFGPLNILSNESTRNQVTAVTNPLEAWPLNGEFDASGNLIILPPEKERLHKNFRVAWILVGVVHLCGLYNDLSDEKNHTINKVCRWKFMKKWGVIIPQDEFEIKMPRFGFWEDRGETPLEAYNRAWEILEYLGSILPGYPGEDYKFMGRSEMWAKRMQNRHCMDEGFFTQQENLPPWMKNGWNHTSDPSQDPKGGTEAAETELCATDLLLSWSDSQEADDLKAFARLADMAKKSASPITPTQGSLLDEPIQPYDGQPKYGVDHHPNDGELDLPPPRSIVRQKKGKTGTEKGAKVANGESLKRKLSASARRPEDQVPGAQGGEEEDSEEEVWNGRSKRRRTRPPTSS